jgi:predicted amidohydrolase
VFYCSWETSANDREIPLDNTNELAVYRAQVQARAVENGVWIVHANAAANLKDRSRGSHGMSRIVDPKGHVVKEASPEAETLLVHKLDMKQSLAKYALKSLDFSFFLREWYISGAAYSNEVAIPPESPRLTPCSPKLK